MHKTKMIIFITWIMAWTPIAIDQLTLTHKYISLEKNLSSVALPGKTVIEKNGTKFMVDFEKAPSIVTKLGLDPVKYKKYKSDKSSMCFAKDSGWNELINFQQGNISLQELKGNLNG